MTDCHLWKGVSRARPGGQKHTGPAPWPLTSSCEGLNPRTCFFPPAVQERMNIPEPWSDTAWPWASSCKGADSQTCCCFPPSHPGKGEHPWAMTSDTAPTLCIYTPDDCQLETLNSSLNNNGRKKEKRKEEEEKKSELVREIVTNGSPRSTPTDKNIDG